MAEIADFPPKVQAFINADMRNNEITNPRITDSWSFYDGTMVYIKYDKSSVPVEQNFMYLWYEPKGEGQIQKFGTGASIVRFFSLYGSKRAELVRLLTDANVIAAFLAIMFSVAFLISGIFHGFQNMDHSLQSLAGTIFAFYFGRIAQSKMGS